MASQSRPRFSASRRTPTRRSRDTGEAVLSLLPDVLSAMASAAGSHNSRAPPREASGRPSVPSAAAPDKCRPGMNKSEFRAWRHSIEWYIKLNRLNDVDAVGHIRLLCASDIQRVVDDRYDVTAWAALSTKDALDAIKQIATIPDNKAALWDKFF